MLCSVLYIHSDGMMQKHRGFLKSSTITRATFSVLLICSYLCTINNKDKKYFIFEFIFWAFKDEPWLYLNFILMIAQAFLHKNECLMFIEIFIFKCKSNDSPFLNFWWNLLNVALFAISFLKSFSEKGRQKLHETVLRLFWGTKIDKDRLQGGVYYTTGFWCCWWMHDLGIRIDRHFYLQNVDIDQGIH